MLCSCLYQPAPSAHSEFLLAQNFDFIMAWFDSFGLIRHQLFSTPVSLASSFLCFVAWCPKRTWLASYLWEPSDAAGQWLVFGLVATWSGVSVSVTCGVESHGLHRFSSLTELNAIYFRRRPDRSFLCPKSLALLYSHLKKQSHSQFFTDWLWEGNIFAALLGILWLS